MVNAIRIGCLPQLPMPLSAAEALKGFVLGCRDQGTLSNGEICGGTNSNQIYIFDYLIFDLLRYKRSAPKQGMVGASNFHLLGVGAEKSSLYRLGFLGLTLMLTL